MKWTGTDLGKDLLGVRVFFWAGLDLRKMMMKTTMMEVVVVGEESESGHGVQ